MPLTERVIETDKTHQRVEAERGARGVQLAGGGTPGDVSPALAREVALDLVDRLRTEYPALHPFMSAAERIGGAEARLGVATAAGVPRRVIEELQDELAAARAVWDGLDGPADADASEALGAYAALLAIVAADPRPS
jgi:hypothetical protein